MFLVKSVYFVQYCTVFYKNIPNPETAAEAVRSFYIIERYQYQYKLYPLYCVEY